MSKPFQQRLESIKETLTSEQHDGLNQLLEVGVDSYATLILLGSNPLTEKAIRRTVAWLAGRLQVRTAITMLLKMLGDSDSDLYVYAANSLGRLRSKLAVEALISMLISSDERIRFAAISALGEIQGPQAMTALLASIESDDTLMRWEASKALSNFKSKAVTRRLIRLLKHSSSEVRAASAYSLGFKHDLEAADPLITVAQNSHEHEDVRAYALEALGHLSYKKPRRALKPLLTMLSDPSIAVRFWSTFALGCIAGPKDEQVIKSLKHLAKHDNALLVGWWTVKEEAQYFLDRIQGRTPREHNWSSESFPASKGSIELSTGDKLKRTVHGEILTLSNGDSLKIDRAGNFRLRTSLSTTVHSNQPGDATIVEYENGDSIAFNASGVFQLIRLGQNVRIRRDIPG